MLTPAQINALSELSQQAMQPVIDFLLDDIARRISEAGQFTSSAAYQIWRAQALGVDRKAIEKELRKRLVVSQKELKKLLVQSAEVGYNFDMKGFGRKAIPFAENRSIQQIVEAAVKLADKDFRNITQTLGFCDPYGKPRELTDAYITSCDYAFNQVITGATDYNTAIRNATKNLADKGIHTINYESGRSTSLEAAVRRNIMSGLGLMQEQISQQNHDAFGADGWEISAHAASAPDHEDIQGKQYTDKEYEELNNSLVRRIGTLHCGHAAFPIILGVNEPQYTPEQLQQFKDDNKKGVTYNGKHYTVYEATQKQRSIERAIRRQKRRILVAESTGDKDALLTSQVRLRRLNEEYGRYSKAVGLPTQRERTMVSGSGSAISVATKVDKNQFERYKAVLKEKAPETLEEFLNIKYNEKADWESLKYYYRTVKRYEIDGVVSVEKIIELDNLAYKTKKSGFDSSELTGKQKKDIRNLSRSGNVAVMEIDGEIYFSHSRVGRIDSVEYSAYRGDYPLVGLSEHRRFKVKDLGDGIPRENDTEAKLLEFLASKKMPSDKFTVTILSEKHICESCQGVVEQFKRMFPNATVNVVSGKRKYNSSENGLKTWKYRK